MSHAATILLSHQEALLSATLPPDEPAQQKRREAITDALEAAYEQMIEAIDPSLVVEVGAHEASHSVRVKQNRPSRRVVAFEANPQIYAKHVERLRAAGVEYRPQAVGAAPGVATLATPDFGTWENTLMGSTLALPAKPVASSFEVPMTTLDEALGPMREEASIWIDVEGAVGQVIEGAGETLSAAACVYLETETRRIWTGQWTAEEVMAALRARGLVPLLRDIYREGWQFNLLCVREEHLARPEVQAVAAAYLDGALGALRRA